VTLTWRPTDDLTAFVSYKRGYRGPGMNANYSAGTYEAGSENFYHGETTEGVEGGVKATLLDRSLSVQADAYRYNYKSIQVSFVNARDFQVFVQPGADARVQGVELATTYSPPSVAGLAFNGAINYNDSHYTSFPGAPCYSGEPAGTAVGFCDYTLANPGQNLKGKTLAHAPKVTAQVGASYQTELTSTYAMAVTGNVNYSSSYESNPYYNPFGIQHAFATIDASIRFGKLDGPWELALIGRDLTNKYFYSSGLDEGQAIASLAGTTGDSIIYVNRPRQIMLQLTVRPDLF
jgi:outer membrane receptor protein involved in Fe transport